MRAARHLGNSVLDPAGILKEGDIGSRGFFQQLNNREIAWFVFVGQLDRQGHTIKESAAGGVSDISPSKEFPPLHLLIFQLFRILDLGLAHSNTFLQLVDVLLLLVILRLG